MTSNKARHDVMSMLALACGTILLYLGVTLADGRYSLAGLGAALLVAILSLTA